MKFSGQVYSRKCRLFAICVLYLAIGFTVLGCSAQHESLKSEPRNQRLDTEGPSGNESETEDSDEQVSEDEEDQMEPVEMDLEIPNFNTLVNLLESHRCFDCHGSDLDTYDNILFEDRVIPDDPFNSKLYTWLESGAMPPGSDRIPDKDIEKIKDWIGAGAPQ